MLQIFFQVRFFFTCKLNDGKQKFAIKCVCIPLDVFTAGEQWEKQAHDSREQPVQYIRYILSEFFLMRVCLAFRIHVPVRRGAFQCGMIAVGNPD